MSTSKVEALPKGTYIPGPARVMTILHLCLAFAALLWIAGYPFTGELYTIKSRKILYEQVMTGKHTERYTQLPAPKQNQIEIAYNQINQAATRPFIDKLHDAIAIVAYGPSAFERAWIVFSIVIGILVLCKYQGALLACWLLPLIAMAFAIDNAYEGEVSSVPVDYASLPSEKYLVERYNDGPLSNDIMEQYHELTSAWEKYLIVEWAKLIPSKDPATRSQQKDIGEFAFLLERVGSLPQFKLDSIQSVFHKKLNPFLLGIYILWNLLFAVSVNYWCRSGNC